MHRLLVLSLVVVLLAPAQSEGDEQLFREHVAPIFQRRCLSCHNAQDKKGDLSLQTPDDLTENAFVEPGDAEGSHLIEMITPEGGKAEMPKKADSLKPAQIAAIRRWIDAGAKWPDGLQLDEPSVTDTDWWSLQPIVRSEVPEVDAATGDKRGGEDEFVVRTPIDAFVLARLLEKDLAPAPAADRRTLARRLYFDLIGLPPDPAELDAFVADTDPAAYEKLVDRLLASPHYGERWARHWLDVVHYGDTHGYDKDKLRPNAWPYRDYVIRAFNDDTPYGRFVKEQLAGDVLYTSELHLIAATGFIAAGPWDFIGHVEVPATKQDGRIARNLDRDDMVVNTMQTFCGVTVGCARCHNHKFDPVTQEDYYSLQAVFAAIGRNDRPYEASLESGNKRSDLTQRKKKLDERRTRLAARIQRAGSRELASIDKRIAGLEARLAATNTPAAGERSPRYGYHSQVAAAQDGVKWVQVDLGRPVEIDKVLLFGADEFGWADFGFPHRFKIEASDDASFQDSKVIADHSNADYPRPGGMAAAFEATDTTARYVRVTGNKLWNRRVKGKPLTNDWIFAIGELAVLSQGTNVAKGAAVTALDTIDAPDRWSRDNLVDGVYGKYPYPLLASAGGDATSPSNGYHSNFADKAETAKWVQVDLGSSQKLDRIELFPARPTDFADTPGFGFPVRFKLEVSDDAVFDTSRIIIDQTAADVASPGDVAQIYDTQEIQGRYIRLTATRLWDRGDKKYALALSELRAYGNGKNLAESANVTASDTINSDRWHTRFLVDGYSSRAALADEATVLLSLVTSNDGREELAALKKQRAALFAKLVPHELPQELADVEADLKQVEADLAALSKRSMVYAAATQFKAQGGHQPSKGKAAPIFVLKRGNIDQHLQPVGPGTLRLPGGLPGRFELPDDHSEGDRRVALAGWITDRRNPLTWRTIVNRIWQYHFGRGIVASPNDFGRMGQPPSHPKLLDWLAVEFRDGGQWITRPQSIKQLHKLIVTSAVYRQAPAHNEKFAEMDSGNQYLWRFARRRLEAEAIRDAVLLVSGKLNRKMYGPGFRDFVLEQTAHSPQFVYEKHDPDDASTHRRSVYRFLPRSQPQPFMETLDCADPSQQVAKRDETVTPLSALALLNNKFMVRMAEHFATRLEKEHDNRKDQIDLAFRLTLARPPTDDERAALVAHAAKHGLPSACRVIMNLNEFVFVD